jgi:serine/threonine protein kinase, bacterial
MTTELPLACWYPNPTGEPRQMYWDGEGWCTARLADRPLPETAIPPLPSEQRTRRQVKVALIAAMVVVLAAAGITGCVRTHSPQTPSAQPAPPPRQTAQPAPPPRQSVLPFTGLKSPSGVAVDNAGDLYVTDTGDVPGASGRVLKLAARSATPTVLPFTGLQDPFGVAVDTDGALYVTDFVNKQVLKLAAGSATPTVLPFTGLSYPWGVAVDTGGNLYVVDSGNLARDPWGRRAWAVKLPAGSSTQTELPFTGLSGPAGVAVDAAGNLYLADSRNSRVLKLAAGSSTQAVLPFTGLNFPTGVAVDAVGNLYVVDFGNDRVLKLAAGSSTQAVLPFTGVDDPSGVAVDTAGNVYVTDRKNSRVVKLAAR